MQSTLNIDEIARQGEAYRRKKRNRILRFLVSLLLIVVLGSWLWSRVWPPPGTLLSYEEGTWRALTPCGAANDIESSRNGDLWVQSRLFARVCHYDGADFTVFAPRQMSPNALGLGDIAVQGDAVWATVGNGVVRYDGEQWQLFPEIDDLIDGQIVPIVANDLGVFVAEQYGNVLFFDGNTWSRWHLAEVFSKLQEPTPTYPRLEVASEELWVLYYGLWHFDGETWDQIEAIREDIAEYYGFLGAEANAVWLSDGSSVLRIELNGDWQQFPYEEIGLPAYAHVYRAVADDDTMWFATSDGLLTYDRNTWHTPSVPAIESPFPILDIAFNRAQPVVAAATGLVYDEDFVNDYANQYVLALQTPNVLFPFALALLFVPLLRSNVRRTRQAHALLLEAIPNLEQHLSLFRTDRAGNALSLRFIAVLIVGLVLPFSGIQLLPMFCILIGLVHVLNVVPILVNLRNPTLDLANRAYVRRMTVQMSLFTSIFMLGLLLSLLLINAIVGRLFQDWPPAFLFVALFAVVLADFGLWLTSSLPALLITRRYVAGGHYAAALERIESWQHFFVSRWHRLYFESYVLSLTARYEDAEWALRKTLAEGQNNGPPALASTIVSLGQILDSEGRYDEAFKVLSAALKMLPDERLPYRELAQHFLRRGLEPNTALQLTSIMMRFTRRPIRHISNEYAQWAVTMGVRAWALAATEDFSAADAMMKRAFEKTDRRFKPQLAALHFISGMVERLKGNIVGAHEQFAAATALDPDGAAGQWAARANSELTN
jgi:tetratricopeptide (TPR) repeat protein